MIALAFLLSFRSSPLSSGCYERYNRLSGPPETLFDFHSLLSPRKLILSLSLTRNCDPKRISLQLTRSGFIRIGREVVATHDCLFFLFFFPFNEAIEKLRSSRRGVAVINYGRSVTVQRFLEGVSNRETLRSISKYGEKRGQRGAMISRRFSRCETCLAGGRCSLR